MRDSDLDPVAAANVLTGVGVRPLGPRHPGCPVLPDRDHRTVIEAAGPALIADQPGGAEPARGVDARDGNGTAGDTVLAGRRRARYHEQRPAGSSGRRRVVTGAEPGRQDGPRLPPCRRARAPRPDRRLRPGGPEAGRRDRARSAILRRGWLAEAALRPGRHLLYSRCGRGARPPGHRGWTQDRARARRRARGSRQHASSPSGQPAGLSIGAHPDAPP